MTDVLKYLVLVLIVSLSGCEQIAEVESAKIYSHDGISFKYPGNWNVTEDYEIGDVRLLFVESPGSGMMTIEVYDYQDSLSLRDFVDVDIESLVSRVKSSFLVIDSIAVVRHQKVVNDKPFIGFRYEIEYSFLGFNVPHFTEVFQLSNGEKSAYLSGQVATEDGHLVVPGFDLLMASFSLEET
ncbi:hypothetical protein VHTUMSATKI_14860 [Vibrio harveyi]|uniref:hypothetical protein n=1 Tax=Vibrio harveyi TaxID=669 RepID=UPI0036F2ECAF